MKNALARIVLLENGRIIRTNNVVFKEQDIVLATHKAPGQIHVPVDPPATPLPADDPVPERFPRPPRQSRVSGVVPQKRMRAEDFYESSHAGEPADEVHVHPPEDDMVDELEAMYQDLGINPMNIVTDLLNPDYARTAAINNADGNPHRVPAVAAGPHPAPTSRVSTRITKGRLPSRFATLCAFVADITASTPTRYAGLCAFVAALSASADKPDPTEPKSLREAQSDIDWPRWLEGMTDEHDSLKTNFTWTLVDPPAGCKVLNGKWVFKCDMLGPGDRTRSAVYGIY